MVEENIKKQLLNYFSFITKALDDVEACFHDNKKEAALMHIGALIANVRKVNMQLEQFRPKPEPDIKPAEQVN